MIPAPLISIVIANRDYGRFLGEAIESVIAQGMGDKVELIICDGGSTDNSVEIIRRYADGLPPNIERHEWQKSSSAGAGTTCSSSTRKGKVDEEGTARFGDRGYGETGGGVRDGVHQFLSAGVGCTILDDEGCIRLFGTAHPLGPHGAFEHDPPTAIRAASERLEQIARENGVYLSDETLRQIVSGHRKIRRSGESEVYLDPERKQYVKLYDPFAKLGIRRGRVEEVIYNIVAHNLLFPETRYTFLGVTHGPSGVRFVLLQDEVESIQAVNEKQIAKVLVSRLGLAKDGRYSFGNDYYSITDIGASSDNVLLDKNKELKFIDPIIVFKRPADEVIAHLSSNSQLATRNSHLITWWCSEPDGGQSAAFNKGFSHARGRFLTWLNADDVFTTGALKAVEREILRHPKCEWFIGSSCYADENLRVTKCFCAHRFSILRAKWGFLSAGGPSSFFTKRLLDAVGGMDESLHYLMDTDLWYKFSRMCGVKYRRTRHNVFAYRQHEASKMSGADRHTTERALANRRKANAEGEVLSARYGLRHGFIYRLAHVLSLSFADNIVAVYRTAAWRGRKTTEV